MLFVIGKAQRKIFEESILIPCSSCKKSPQNSVVILHSIDWFLIPTIPFRKTQELYCPHCGKVEAKDELLQPIPTPLWAWSGTALIALLFYLSSSGILKQLLSRF